MFSFVALFAATTAGIPYVAPTSFACYASRDRASDHVIVITDAPKPTLNSRGLRRIECPEDMNWTPDEAKRQCAFLRHYDFETAYHYIELHGISPSEVCEEGRRAAGLIVDVDD